MSVETIIFYILGVLIITFGVLTVFTRKIFRAAVFLLFSLIGIAGVYILMDMQFVAALQIVVYVGGIVVLIIFSIFLTHSSGERLAPQRLSRIIRASILSAIGMLFSIWIITHHFFLPTTARPIEHSVQNIGLQLLSYTSYGYVFPFEVVSVLLLAALVGSIVIAMKIKKQ